jgi:hypothetical protein
MHECIELERQGWNALSTSPAAAMQFYAEALAREVVMAFPQGMLVSDREQIVTSMGGPPWSTYELTDERALALADDAVLVSYRAAAVREGEPYRAICSSGYTREDGQWRLAFHQQTPY